MSRLDSVIRRLTAQRLCLQWAVDATRDVPGVVLEVGLGNGRTYDHLRSLVGDRPIYAMDRAVNAHPDCVPDAAHLILGDFRDTMPGLRARLSAPVALVHADVGSGDAQASAALARSLAPALDPALAAGAVIACDQDMQPPPALGWTTAALPSDVSSGRYFLYRKR